MYKLIACDLDETLLNVDKEICERNLKAIFKATKEYGVKFVPATGRGYTGFDAVLQALEVVDKEGEYVISNNGAIVSENAGHRHLSFHGLSFETAKTIFKFAYSKNVCMQVFSAKDVYAFHINEDEKKWLFSFKKDSYLCDQDHIDFLENVPITKILLQNLDRSYLQGLYKELAPLVAGEITESYSSGRYLELNHNGVDKGLGLRELAEYLGIDMKDTIAIGDNFNDIGMLKVAGLSVAVANAQPEIKAMCDYVTTSDHNEGGVAEVIEKYIFGEGK